MCAVLRPFNSCHEIPFNSAVAAHVEWVDRLSEDVPQFVASVICQNPLKIAVAKGHAFLPLLHRHWINSEEGVIAIPFRNPSKVACVFAIARSFVPYRTERGPAPLLLLPRVTSFADGGPVRPPSPFYLPHA